MKSAFKIAFLFLLPLFPARAQTEIGLQLYSLRNHLPKNVPTMLDRIKAMGIRELEGGDTYGYTLADFQKLLAERQMKMVAIGADFDQLDKDPAQVVAQARAWNVSYVVCYWIPHHGDDFTLNDMNRAILVFSKAGEHLRKAGITLCYHPHGFEFRPHGSGTLFDHLATSVPATFLNFEMDVFWVKHPGQDPVALLKKYPNRFELMHLKDRQKGTEGNQTGHADEETNVVLGTGDVGIAAIMETAVKAGTKYFFIEDESSRVLEQIPASISYLRSLEKKK